MKISNNEIIIRPKKIFSIRDIQEIWTYRDLLYTFIWRDIKVRYKQTLLGIAWVILQPIVSMVIFTVLFGNLAKVPSGNLPYSLFVLCGLVFWQFFAGSISGASDSMISNEAIIQKVYFPKIILPLVSVVTNFVDFMINFTILLLYASVIGYYPNWHALIIIPVAIFISVITASGVGLLLSSMNVKYRDVRYILPFFIQILLFLTPVIYPLSIVSDRNKYLMALNPMTSVIESVRLMFVEGYIMSINLFLVSFLSALFIFFFGVGFFYKTQRFFADII
ncbi:ABC transporter permease [Candidatus Roizmanbacteria bacterium]|nr:ABC transporter permease [Candidatus Roizmanbacteria bacterium]